MAQASASGGGGVLLFVCVGTLLVASAAALVVGILALRSARRVAGLAEERMRYLREEHKRLEFLRQERRALADELERERQERRGPWPDEPPERAREARLEARQRVERAGQEARSAFTSRRAAAGGHARRLDDHLEELEDDDDDDAWPPGGMRRVK